LGTELNAKNKIQASGSLAVPVLIYSFGIINWHREELQKLDWKTRKLLTIHGQHHPKGVVDHLYVPRKQGGRGLTPKRPPGVKFDPSLCFSSITFFGVSYNDTNLGDCHKCPLGRHCGFVLLVINVFLKFRFSQPEVTSDPRWPCGCCISVFSFVHFYGDNVL